MTIRRKLVASLMECGFLQWDAHEVVKRYIKSDMGRALLPYPNSSGERCTPHQIVAWWRGVTREGVAYMEECYPEATAFRDHVKELALNDIFYE